MNLKEIPCSDHFDPFANPNLERIRLLVRPPPTDLPVALAKVLLPLFWLESDFGRYREYAQRAVAHYLSVEKAWPKVDLDHLMICQCGLDPHEDLRLIDWFREIQNGLWLRMCCGLRSDIFLHMASIMRCANEIRTPDTGATDAMIKRNIRSRPWLLSHTIVRSTEARIVLLNLLQDAVANGEWTG